MSALGNATSGLLAFQRALATTSHNISNVTTQGYSRQQIELSTRNPQFIGGSYLGQGVTMSSVRRLQDDLVDSHLRSSLSDSANGSVRAEYAERIDRLLADASTGLAPTLENYFAAVQDAANDPTDTAARTVMLGEAEALEERFDTLASQLDEQRTLINGQLETSVEEINQISRSIADLNSEVAAGFASGSPPNDLLDKRDQLLRDLAEKVDVNISTQDDGAINVFIGNGQPLVMRGTATELTTENFSGDPFNPGIGLVVSGDEEPVEITRFITGGELGGLLEVRGSILDAAQNELGLIALNLGAEFNRQNSLGLDLEGNLGGEIFGLPEPRVYGNRDNTATSLPSVAIADARALTPSDYRLSFDGTTWGLTTQPDNQPVAFTEDPAGVLHADGLVIDTSTIAGPDVGDRWLIQPTRAAAEKLTVTLTDPMGIAATSGALAASGNTGDARLTKLSLTVDPPAPETYTPSAVVVDAAGDYQLLQPALGADSGDLKIESFSVLDPTHADLLDAVPITFDPVKNQFQVGDEFVSLDPSGTTTIAANGWELRVRGAPSGPDALRLDAGVLTAVTDATGLTTLTTPAASGADWQLQLRGTPAQGDVFTIELSKDRPGDNRNLLAMSDLQDRKIIEGERSFQNGYNSLLADVGTQTRQAQIARDSSIAVLEAAQAQREAISGVNLDEEAANLIRYQQAYQAAAQVVSVTSTMFDTLIAAVGR